MICHLPKQLEEQLFDKQGLTNPKIKQIARIKKSFFFSRTNDAIDCFDRFQNADDVQNEFKKIVYTPIFSLKLALTHLLNVVFDLISALFELIFSIGKFFFLALNPSVIIHEEPVDPILLNSLNEFGMFLFYVGLSVVSFADALLEFTLRCVITLVEEGLDTEPDAVIAMPVDAHNVKELIASAPIAEVCNYSAS